MKLLFFTSIILSISLAYAGFFDDLVSDVKSAGESISSGAASAYNWTTEVAAPRVGDAVVGAGQAVGNGAVKAYNWTTEEALPKVGETAKEGYREASQKLG